MDNLPDQLLVFRDHRIMVMTPEDRRLSFLDGTPSDETFDQTWTPLVTLPYPRTHEDTSSPNFQHTLMQRYLEQVEKFQSEPKHEFGQIYRIGSEECAVCVNPESSSRAWVLQGRVDIGRMSWSAVLRLSANQSGLPHVITKSAEPPVVLSPSDIHSAEQSFPFGTLFFGHNVAAVCAFPGHSRPWVVRGNGRSSTSLADIMFAEKVHTPHALNPADVDGCLDPVKLGRPDAEVASIIRQLTGVDVETSDVARARERAQVRGLSFASLMDVAHESVDTPHLPDALASCRSSYPLARLVIGALSADRT